MVFKSPRYLHFLKRGLVLRYISVYLHVALLQLTLSLSLKKFRSRCSLNHQLNSGIGRKVDVTTGLDGSSNLMCIYLYTYLLCIYLLCINLLGIYIYIYLLCIYLYTLYIVIYIYIYLHTMYTHMNDIKSPLTICVCFMIHICSSPFLRGHPLPPAPLSVHGVLNVPSNDHAKQAVKREPARSSMGKIRCDVCTGTMG